MGAKLRGHLHAREGLQFRQFRPRRLQVLGGQSRTHLAGQGFHLRPLLRRQLGQTRLFRRLAFLLGLRFGTQRCASAREFFGHGCTGARRTYQGLGHRVPVAALFSRFGLAESRTKLCLCLTRPVDFQPHHTTSNQHQQRHPDKNLPLPCLPLRLCAFA